MTQDELFIKRCIDLADESLRKGDLPFGALVTLGDVIVAEGENTGLSDITGHAEINAIKDALKKDPKIDFSLHTLYTNFEPCAMCSFIIRDYGIGRVVFAVESPHLGGYSKWNILLNNPLPPEFTSRRNPNPPSVTGGVLKDEAQKIFNELKWLMHKS